MNQRTSIFFVAAFLLVAGAAFFWVTNRENGGLPQEVRPAKDFLLHDYEGREVQLSDFRGKNAIINSWASWCPYCVDELPDFAKLQEEFGDKIAVIAIDRRESLEKARAFSDKLGLTGKIILLLDPDDSFYKSIGGFSMPETIFVDKDGLIVFHKRGPMEFEEMKRRTQDAFGL